MCAFISSVQFQLPICPGWRGVVVKESNCEAAVRVHLTPPSARRDWRPRVGGPPSSLGCGFGWRHSRAAELISSSRYSSYPPNDQAGGQPSTGPHRPISWALLPTPTAQTRWAPRRNPTKLDLPPTSSQQALGRSQVTAARARASRGPHVGGTASGLQSCRGKRLWTKRRSLTRCF